MEKERLKERKILRKLGLFICISLVWMFALLPVGCSTGLSGCGTEQKKDTKIQEQKTTESDNGKEDTTSSKNQTESDKSESAKEDSSPEEPKPSKP